MPVKTAKAAPKDHAPTHNVAGDDEISDLKTHATRHESGGADAVTGVVPDVGSGSLGVDNTFLAEEFLYEVSLTVTSGLTSHMIIIEIDWSSPSVRTVDIRLKRGGTSGGTDGTRLETYQWINAWDGPMTFIFISTGAPTGSVLYKVTGEADGSGVTARSGSKITVLTFAG